MFYVKEKINDALSIKTELSDENVFCRCPRCGAEVQVDLNEFFGDENFDLFGSELYCDACSQKARSRE